MTKPKNRIFEAKPQYSAPKKNPRISQKIAILLMNSEISELENDAEFLKILKKVDFPDHDKRYTGPLRIANKMADLGEILKQEYDGLYFRAPKAGSYPSSDAYHTAVDAWLKSQNNGGGWEVELKFPQKSLVR